MSEADIRKKIIEQLKCGACCRDHIHRECLQFGLEEPSKNRSSDLRFDKPFNELVRNGYVHKIQPKKIRIDGDKKEDWKTIDLGKIIDLKNKTVEQIGEYAFYELTEKGKNSLV